MPRNEDLTRKELIDPVLDELGWKANLIKREKTPGGVDIIDGKPRKRQGRVDYLLCLPATGGNQPLPVAVIEAKAENKLPSLGIQQALDYQKRFNVPFVFSSNGHLYATWGEDTRQIETGLNLTAFPTPKDLRRRWEAIKGFNLDTNAARALFISPKGGARALYYFQDAAIRSALEKIARRGDKWNRILIQLATGTGKTILATQLLHKLAESGQLSRALFVVDRDELRSQALGKLMAIFGDNARVVSTDKPNTNARILVASYQTLLGKEENEPLFWNQHFKDLPLSHIIIDECHRSAWGSWSIILEDHSEAVHIGLTATPRIIIGGEGETARQDDEEITAHNLEYFGQPVYEYGITEGQADGYLAACEVIRRAVDLDKIEITREDIEQRSAIDPYTGQTVNPGDIAPSYHVRSYDRVLLLPDRVTAMSEDIFQHLLDTGTPHQKTIIFCASDAHASNVAIELNNIYSRWCQQKQVEPREWFAFMCTGNKDLRPPAKKLIPELRDSKQSHYIATTVDLLSTGVDIPNLENVIFFRYLESPILFYQIVGRGTRIGDPPGSKVMFRIYDYTNATRLFGQPFESRNKPTIGGDEEGEENQTEGDSSTKDRPTRRKANLIQVEGFTVSVAGEGKSILCNEDGIDVLVPVEEYKLRVAAKILAEAENLDSLRTVWVVAPRRRKLLENLPNGELSLRLIRELQDQRDCDLFDVLADLVYGIAAKSRAERTAAFSYKNRNWLRELPEPTANVLSAIAKQFEKGGIEELETTTLYDENDVINAGGIEALIGLGTPPEQLIQEVKLRLLSA